MKKNRIYTPNGQWLLSTRTHTQRRKLISWASKFIVQSNQRRGIEPSDWVKTNYKSPYQHQRQSLGYNTDQWILDMVTSLRFIEKHGLLAFWDAQKRGDIR